MTVTLPSYETMYELDFDGGAGSPTGLLIDGHLDFDDVEQFLASGAVEEEFYDAPARGFDVTHVFWRTEPFIDEDGEQTSSYIYVFDEDATRGGTPATRLEQETTWEKRCFRHPFDVAETGINKAEVPEDQGHLADEHGYIYLCTDCYDSFITRRKAAIERRLAEHAAAQEAAA